MALSPAYYPIVGGSSKFDLMLALFDGRQMFDRAVTFQVSMKPINGSVDKRDALYLKERLLVGISSVGKEDASGESWNIRGDVPPLNPKNSTVIVDIFFDTRERKGTLRFMHADPTPPPIS